MGTGAAVAILGGGKIGEALLAGLVRSGHEPSDVVVSERYPERAGYLTETYGVRVVPPADAATAGVLVVAVKPQDVGAVLAELAPVVSTEQLVVSVAAGITAAQLEGGLPDGVPVVRCMPNTPALLGEGMTALAPGTHATSDHLDTAENLLRGVGRVVRVQEPQLDAVTALSGSGPAYFFLLAEAMTEAGVLLGLPRPLAAEARQPDRGRRGRDAARLGGRRDPVATSGQQPGRHHDRGPSRVREAWCSGGGTGRGGGSSDPQRRARGAAMRRNASKTG